MPSVGEEICGDYLKYILNCDFVSYNVTNPDIQGEIDVVGIDLEKKIIYICEVATHTGGLQYVKDRRPNDYSKLLSKFKKDITYAKKYFKGYSTIIPMFWSPIVRLSSERAKYRIIDELDKLRDQIKKDYNLELDLIINEKYAEAISRLKDVALKETSKFNSPVMRVFQIEKYLERHIRRIRKDSQ